ncbi:O-antigen ligase family protein [Stakelama sp. CBK3Z-3]|uniref:O-antigen ligase family protein n=1 Tax=Stakelama flava TaxID=2860338 RepID=A0ABS6XIA4_9SPHN|nr:O-antigen ligase family protein [Stakelama flava]MBW4329915.1 O-antigen ligase family protein [Stakelama flava]
MSARQATAAALAPTMLFCGWMALGANTSLLGAFFSLASFSGAIVVLHLIPPGPQVWRDLMPAILCFGAALIWAALPLIASIIFPRGMFAVDTLSRASIAPRLVVQCAALAWLIMGTVMGAYAGVSRLSIRILIALSLLWLAMAVTLKALGISYVALWHVPQSQYARFALTMRNANTAGTLLAMLVTLTCAEFLALVDRFADPMRRTGNYPVLKLGIVLGAMSFCAGGIALTQSRMALMLAGLGVMALVVRRGRDLWRHGAVVAVPAISILVVPPLALLALVGGRVLHKFAGLSGDFNLRLRDMIDFAQISFQHPFFGYGLGNFSNVNLATLSETSALHRWNFGAAHNVVLHAALEGGWPYALLILAGGAALATPILQTRRYIAYDIRMLGICAAFAIGVIAGLIDIALDVPVALCLVAWLAGIAFSRTIRARAVAV